MEESANELEHDAQVDNSDATLNTDSASNSANDGSEFSSNEVDYSEVETDSGVIDNSDSSETVNNYYTTEYYCTCTDYSDALLTINETLTDIQLSVNNCTEISFCTSIFLGGVIIGAVLSLIFANFLRVKNG